MPLRSTSYAPRDPAGQVLYQIVREHFETFRAQAASLRDGEGLPRFVEQEFRTFLQCGWLAGGFARFRCGSCGLDRLVAFSCKGRALCPSCGGRRRMAQYLGEQIGALVKQHKPRVLTLDMSRVFDLEYSALQVLVESEKRATEHGAVVWLAGLNPGVLEVVRRVGLDERLGRERMLFNARAAIARDQELQAKAGAAPLPVGS